MKKLEFGNRDKYCVVISGSDGVIGIIEPLKPDPRFYDTTDTDHHWSSEELRELADFMDTTKVGGCAKN